MNTESTTPAGKRLSLRDVAQRAGVAVSTVSRVLSDHPDVSAATKEHVRHVAEELGYRPNALARMLRQGTSRTIGFAVGDISNPLLAQIALGAETALRQHGYSLLLSNSMNDPTRELDNLHSFEQRRVDGLLLSVTDERDQYLVRLLERFDVPMVTIDRTINARAAISSVHSDHHGGITHAVDALAAAGHRRFALITGLAKLRPGRGRIEAAHEAAQRHGIECVTMATDQPDGPPAGDIAALLTGRNAPTAVIAGNNQVLAVLLESLDHEGLHYPRDVSIVTCDEVSLQRFIEPRIAVVRRDSYQLGQASADLLLERLRDTTMQPRSVTLPSSFDPGASIAPPPAGR